jgi:hypothetical protein
MPAANIQGIRRPSEFAPPLRRPTIGDDTQDSVMARSLAAVVLIGLTAGLIPTGIAAAAQQHFAKTLGLTVPPTLLAIANEMIE